MESKDDDYWNDSANKSFNFDEDDVAILELPTGAGNRRSLFGEDTTSEANFASVQSELPLHMIISEADLTSILEDQSRNEMPLLSPKGISVEEEVKLLRKKLQEFSFVPSAASIVAKLILGKCCSLEMFRSLQEKEALLDEAVACGNGNAILKVVLFLEKTLKKKLLYRLLQTRPEAVNHYVNYMALRLQVTECTDLLTYLGRHHEASLLQFSIYVRSTSNIEFKRQRLKKIYSDYFSQPGANSFYAQLVANYINLLELQVVEQHSNNSTAGSILDRSVLETLYYICGRHKWGDTSHQHCNENPFKLAEAHQVAQSQFEWVALNERAKRQAWMDFDHIFEKKAWLNLTKQKSLNIHIPIDRTILRLFALHAPDPVLNNFLAKVEDPQRRLALARRVNARRGIVDALVALKDRPELENFARSLEGGTEERYYADKALKSLETYYNPRDAKADKKHPSGLIYDRFHNRNKKKLVQAKSTPGTETIYSKEKTAALNLPEDYISKLTTLKNWLRNNFAPTEEVTQKWKDSLLLRLRSIINEADIDKGNVLSEWPRITDEAGYLLIDSDFDHLYGKSDELFDHWEEFSQNFLNYIRSSEIKDDRSRKLLDIHSKPDICQGGRDLILSFVFQALIKPTRRSSGKLPTILEAQLDVCYLCDSYDEYIDHLQSTRRDCQTAKVQVAPRIYAIGSFEDVEAFYVATGKFEYKLPSFLRCLDVVIKLTHVLEYRFAESCEIFWCFLTRYFYGIDYKRKSKNGQLLQLTSYLDSCRTEAQ